MSVRPKACRHMTAPSYRADAAFPSCGPGKRWSMLPRKQIAHSLIAPFIRGIYFMSGRGGPHDQINIIFHLRFSSLEHLNNN